MLKYILKRIRAKWQVLLMLVPFFALFFLFTVYPVCRSIFYSFTNYDVFSPPQFIGFKNYVTLFSDDPIFVKAFGNTIVFAVVTGPIGYLLSLIVAWFINDCGRKMRWILTFVFYAPALSGSAITIFTYLFSADRHGLINSMLINIGIINEPVAWFKNPVYMLGTVMVVQLWMSLGTGFLAFVAGLQGISKSLYEAGAVDGIKNKWQEMWFITLSSLRPQLMFGAVMQITSSFAVSDICMNLCGFPSVEYAAETIVTHLKDYGLVRFEFGYASAIATVLFAIMIITNEIVQFFLRRVGE